MAASENRLDDNDWASIATWLKAELERRRSKRKDREKIWKEIDRQIAMTARNRDPREKVPAWYPAIELPLQFNALEVIAADARRLLFPRSGTWYRVSAELSDRYLARWQQRRMAGVQTGNPAMDQAMQQLGVNAGTPAPLVGSEPVPMDIDQETADALVRAAIDHFHRFYNFKASIDLFLAEEIKYGTGVVRVRPVRNAFFSHEYRGERGREVRGPAVIPCSIWNTYLDDSWSALLHEGEHLGPATIRCYWQPLDDLKRAAQAKDAGWMPDKVGRLVMKTGPDDKRGQVELIEFEGDVLVPKSEGSILLPNSIVTVAVGNSAEVVRFRKNPMPFRSYVTGHYFRHDIRHAYGDSPLMKGEPLQTMNTEMGNDLMAVGRLNALPPVAYDRNDPNLAAQGGPQIYPGALWPTDAPNSIEAQEIGDPQAMMVAYAGLTKQYEDTTGVNDARRGQRLKSHTTAQAADIEAAQGISRTDDFIVDQMTGPLPTILHMEFEIIKSTMGSAQPISVGAEGIEGWINLAADDMADRAEFEVIGAEGAIADRERLESFIAANNFAIQTATAAAQLGIPVPLNFEAMVREVYERAGIANPSKFVGAVSTVTGGAALESNIPGITVPDAGVGAQAANGVQPVEQAAPGDAIQ